MHFLSKTPYPFVYKYLIVTTRMFDLYRIFATIEDMTAIEVLNAFGDNYIYLAEYDPGACFVVDPGNAQTVLSEINKRCLNLTHILITHYHFDHIGGVEQLKSKTACKVIGPGSQASCAIDTAVGNGDMVELADLNIRCIATPGHTGADVCYFVTGPSLNSPVLFTGDTMFVCGCGRVMGASMETMFKSLQKLATLPDETRVYPGHDYTEENLRFALTFEPDNDALLEKHKQVLEQTAAGKPTVPSTMVQEKQLNPFLRAQDWQTFAKLRKKKDVF